MFAETIRASLPKFKVSIPGLKFNFQGLQFFCRSTYAKFIKSFRMLHAELSVLISRVVHRTYQFWMLCMQNHPP
ncbi:unnamed protein product [Arabidopsis halleri]